MVWGSVASPLVAVEASPCCERPARLERMSAVDMVGDEAADLGAENEVDLFIAGLFTLDGWLIEYVLLGIFLSVGRENFVNLMIRPIETPFDCLPIQHDIRTLCMLFLQRIGTYIGTLSTWRAAGSSRDEVRSRRVQRGVTAAASQSVVDVKRRTSLHRKCIR